MRRSRLQASSLGTQVDYADMSKRPAAAVRMMDGPVMRDGGGRARARGSNGLGRSREGALQRGQGKRSSQQRWLTVVKVTKRVGSPQKPH